MSLVVASRYGHAVLWTPPRNYYGILAGHQVDELEIFSNGQNGGGGTPHGMAMDLTTLFEAAGSYSILPNEYGLISAESMNGDFTSTLGQENDDLSKIMRDLF